MIRVTVTVTSRDKSAPPALAKEDVMVRQDNERRPVIDWVPAQGDRAGLDQRTGHSGDRAAAEHELRHLAVPPQLRLGVDLTDVVVGPASRFNAGARGGCFARERGCFGRGTARGIFSGPAGVAPR